jgi:hypothetical protein
LDDFFEAYFGESDGDEFKDVKLDLAPKDELKLDDSFKIFKVNNDGYKEDY